MIPTAVATALLREVRRWRVEAEKAHEDAEMFSSEEHKWMWTEGWAEGSEDKADKLERLLARYGIDIGPEGRE